MTPVWLDKSNRKQSPPWLVKGFTGTLQDSLGRERCYRDGTPIHCVGQTEAAAVQQKLGTAILADLGRATWAHLKNAGHKIEEVEQAAKDWANKRIATNMAKLPPKWQAAARGAFLAVRFGYKAAFATYAAGQALAAKVAEERGASPEQVTRLKAALTTIDVFTFKTVTFPVVAAVAGPGAATAATFVPLGTAMYLCYSTARDPRATVRGARALLRDVGKKLRVFKALGKPHHDSEKWARQVDAYLLAGGEDEGDWRLALLLAALDETGQPVLALRLAKAAARKVGPQPGGLGDKAMELGSNAGVSGNGSIEENASNRPGVFGKDTPPWLNKMAGVAKAGKNKKDEYDKRLELLADVLAFLFDERVLQAAVQRFSRPKGRTKALGTTPQVPPSSGISSPLPQVPKVMPGQPCGPGQTEAKTGCKPQATTAQEQEDPSKANLQKLQTMTIAYLIGLKQTLGVIGSYKTKNDLIGLIVNQLGPNPLPQVKTKSDLAISKIKQIMASDQKQEQKAIAVAQALAEIDSWGLLAVKEGLQAKGSYPAKATDYAKKLAEVILAKSPSSWKQGESETFQKQPDQEQSIDVDVGSKPQVSKIGDQVVKPPELGTAFTPVIKPSDLPKVPKVKHAGLQLILNELYQAALTGDMALLKNTDTSYYDFAKKYKQELLNALKAKGVVEVKPKEKVEPVAAPPAPAKIGLAPDELPLKPPFVSPANIKVADDLMQLALDGDMNGLMGYLIENNNKHALEYKAQLIQALKNKQGATVGASGKPGSTTPAAGLTKAELPSAPVFDHPENQQAILTMQQLAIQGDLTGLEDYKYPNATAPNSMEMYKQKLIGALKKKQGGTSEVVPTKDDQKKLGKPTLSQLNDIKSNLKKYIDQDPHAPNSPWGPKPIGKVGYGGVILNSEGQVLLREPTNHYDGYHWTFPKGSPESGQHPAETASREVLEESGIYGKIVDYLPGAHKSGLSSNYYYVMQPEAEDNSKMDAETSSTKWVNLDEAANLIKKGTNVHGVNRDLGVLAALQHYQKSKEKYTGEYTDALGNHYYYVNGLMTDESGYKEATNNKSPSTVPQDEVGGDPLKYLTDKNSDVVKQYKKADGTDGLVIKVGKESIEGKELDKIGIHWSNSKQGFTLPIADVLGVQKAAEALQVSKKIKQDEITKAAALAESLKIKPPVLPEGVSDDFPADLTGLKYKSTLGGTTGGGAKLMEDADGNRFVLKKGNSPGHLRAEVAADSVYQSLGYGVPPSKTYDTADGPSKLSAYLLDSSTLSEYLKQHPDQKEKVYAELRKGFVLDALLGNWDVIGQDADNVLVSQDGQVWRVDNGGSFNYRAQGKQKEAGWWGPEVKDIDSMRDASLNPQTAKIYQGITDEQIAGQVKALLKRKNDLLGAITDPATSEMIAKRLNWLGKKYIPAEEVKFEHSIYASDDHPDWKDVKPQQGVTFKPPTAEKNNVLFHQYDDNEVRKPVSDSSLAKSFVDHSASAIGQLSWSQHSSVVSYTGSLYGLLNDRMRKCPETLDCLGDYDKHAQNIQEALSKAGVMEQPITVWRRINLGKEDLGKFMKVVKHALETGAAVRMPGFKSCSTSLGSWSGNVSFEIRARTGLYVKPISKHETEDEFLQGHSVRYRVTGIKKVKLGGYGGTSEVIQLEEIV